MRKMTASAAIALATLSAPVMAPAYPIDCAILLCLAGGFPSSAECTAAKVEMIRRITPFPIEPPLQLWNCPMTIPASLMAELALPAPDVGPDGLTPDVRAYRDGIEIYHISQYRRWQSDGDVNVIDNTSKGVYGTDGRFSWVPSSYERGPAWLAEVSGGRTITVRTCTRDSGGDNETCISWATHTENRAGNSLGSLRGVAIRTRDHEGKYTTEFARY